MHWEKKSHKHNTRTDSKWECAEILASSNKSTCILVFI